MTPEAFTQIMSPLQEKYPKHFIPETMKPIYRIIGHLTIDQARQVVGSLILRHRFAPLEQDFKDAVHDIARPRQFIKPIEDRFDPIFSDEERKEIWSFVKRVATGSVAKKEIEAYIDVLNGVITRFYSR